MAKVYWLASNCVWVVVVVVRDAVSIVLFGVDVRVFVRMNKEGNIIIVIIL